MRHGQGTKDMDHFDSIGSSVFRHCTCSRSVAFERDEINVRVQHDEGRQTLRSCHLLARAANSSRPKAVPAMPQPPSAASQRSTHVRAACVGSLAILATISVASVTKLRWPALFNAPGGVST